MTDKTYWNSKGKYQAESDILAKLVPTEGSSQFTDIELYRIATNIYYDIFNNGGGNLDGARNDQFKILEGYGFDMPILNKIIEAQEMEDGEQVGDPDEFFEDAQIEIENVMDQVIERIRTMPKNHLEVIEN